MTNLGYCCQAFGQQGGTIHQFSKMFNIETSVLLEMSQEKLKTIIDNYKESKLYET